MYAKSTSLHNTKTKNNINHASHINFENYVLELHKSTI